MALPTRVTTKGVNSEAVTPLDKRIRGPYLVCEGSHEQDIAAWSLASNWFGTDAGDWYWATHALPRA